jgi:hypothetical protein
MSIAGVLLSHLAPLLGSARGRLTPGLLRAHFVVAGAWIATFVLFVPFLLSLYFVETNGQRLTIVAVCFATVALFCFVVQTFAVVLVLIGLAFSIETLGLVQVTRPLSAFESAALFAVAALSLIGAALRIAHSDAEETMSTEGGLPQQAGRLTGQLIQFARQLARRATDAIQQLGAAIPIDQGNDRWPPDTSQMPCVMRLRTLGGTAPGAAEGLWRRARHWDAAWQTNGTATLWGATVGGTLIAIDLCSQRPDVYPCAIAVGLLPIIALFFTVFATYGESWPRLAAEFLRPFSREQFVQAVGWAIMTALVRFILLAVVIPALVFWFRGRLSLTGGAFWWTVAVLAWLPLFLAAALANLPSYEAIFWAILLLVSYGLFLVITVAADAIEPYPTGLLCAVLLTIGLLSLRGAYRSWLNREPEEGRIP